MALGIVLVALVLIAVSHANGVLFVQLVIGANGIAHLVERQTVLQVVEHLDMGVGSPGRLLARPLEHQATT